MQANLSPKDICMKEKDQKKKPHVYSGQGTCSRVYKELGLIKMELRLQ